MAIPVVIAKVADKALDFMNKATDLVTDTKKYTDGVNELVDTEGYHLRNEIIQNSTELTDKEKLEASHRNDDKLQDAKTRAGEDIQKEREQMAKVLLTIASGGINLAVEGVKRLAKPDPIEVTDAPREVLTDGAKPVTVIPAEAVTAEDGEQ